MSGQHRLSSLLAFFFSLCVSFTTASAVDLDPSTHQAIPGDFNGDGRIDALLQPLTDTVGGALLLQDGTGNLSVVAQGWNPGYLGLDWSAGKSAITTADLNGDGLADVVIQPRQTGGNAAVLITDPTVQLLQVAQVIPANYLGLDWSTDGHVLVAGDFDGDQQKELLLQAATPGVLSAIVHADISGHLVAVTQAIPDGYLNRRWDAEDVTLYVGDFNGDGRQDLLIQVNAGHEKAGESSYALLLADPNGHFTQVSEVWNDSDFGGDWSPATHTLSVQTINGVTSVVLTAKDSSGSNYVFQLNSNGVFEKPAVQWTGTESAADALKSKTTRNGISVAVQPTAKTAQMAPATSTPMQAMTMAMMVGTGPAAPNATGETSGSGGASGGTAMYSIPIAVPPGRDGMQPSISLTYSSRGGNGELGMGWVLSASSAIHRCPATMAQDGYSLGVTYSSTDRLCLDGQHLKLVSGTYGQSGAVYHTELETYARITQTGNLSDGTGEFEVDYRDGRKAYYGNISSAGTNTVMTAAGVTAPLEWAIGLAQDPYNNAMIYNYASYGNGEYHLYSINYTAVNNGSTVTAGTRLVKFAYTTRADPSVSYLAGGETAQTQVLTGISTFENTIEVRNYNLNYASSNATNRSLLQSVQECAYDSSNNQYCLPATNFGWQNPTPSFAPYSPFAVGDSGVVPNVAATPDYIGTGVRQALFAEYSGSTQVLSLLQLDPNLNPVGSPLYLGEAFGSLSQADQVGMALAIGKGFGSDFNNDGAGDILFQSQTAVNGLYPIWIATSTHQGFGFNALVNTGITAVESDANLVASGDYSGKGWSDIAVSRIEKDGSNNPTGTTDVQVFINPGTGSVSGFTPASSSGPLVTINDGCKTINNANLSPTVTPTGDMDGNGVPDLMVNGFCETPSAGAAALPEGVVFMSHTTSGQVTATYKTLVSMGITYFQNYGSCPTCTYKFLDINGDGLPDFLFTDGDGTGDWLYQLNQGNGTFGPIVNTGVATGSLRPAAMLVGDLRGDGKDMLLYPGPESEDGALWCVEKKINGGTDTTQVCGGTMDNQFAQFDQTIYHYYALSFEQNSAGVYIPTPHDYHIYATPGSTVGDLNGDGLPEVSYGLDGTIWTGYWSTNCSTDKCSNTDGFQVQKEMSTASDLMTQVTTGLGNQSNWQYSPLSALLNATSGSSYSVSYPCTTAPNTSDYFCFGSSMYVVSGYQTSDGVGGQRGYTYTYKDAIYNNKGRGFQGFNVIAVNDLAANLTSTSTYRQDFPYTGALTESKVTVTSTGAMVSDTNTIYCGPGQNACPTVITPYGTYWVSPASSTESHYDPLGGSALISTVSTHYGYDGNSLTYGHVASTNAVTSDTTGDSNTVITTPTYAPDNTHYCLDELSARTVESEVSYASLPGSYTLAASAADISRVVNYMPYNSSCRITETKQDPGTSFEKDTSYTYDSYGNTATVTVSTPIATPPTGTLSTGQDYGFQSRAVTTVYASPDSYFAGTVSNALSQTTTMVVDPRFGEPTSVTDPNGVVTSYSYDAFGRKTQEVDGPMSPINVSYVGPHDSSTLGKTPPNAAYAVNAVQSGFPGKTTYYDIFNRSVGTGVSGFSSPSSVETQYDNLGRVTGVSEPFGSGATPIWNTTSYDVIDRPINKTDAQGVQTGYSYSGLTTTITTTPGDGSYGGAPNRVDIETRNAMGKLLSVENGSGAGSSVDGTTQYRYDAQGNPVVIQDATGHQIVATYNQLGQKSTVSDPDQGSSSYAYDELGELLQQTDAKGQQITMSYDQLGRMTTKLQPESATPTTWTYDSCTHGVGKLCQVNQAQRPGETAPYQETYVYDGHSRPKSETETINGTPYTTTTSYDGDSRVATVTYPGTTLDSPPTANAGTNQTLLFGAAVTLSGSSSSDSDGPSPLGYLWNETSTFTSDGVTGKTTPTTSFTPTVGGVYTFNLTVNDGLLTNSGSTTVTVNPVAPASMQVSVDGDFYNSSDTTIDGTASFQWGSSGGANSYLLMQSVNGGAYTQVASYGATTTSLTGVGSTSENDTITYKTNGYANGAQSADSPTTSLKVMYTPAQPASASAPSGSNWDGSFAVSWAKPSVGVVTEYDVSVGNFYLVDGKEQWQEAANCKSVSSNRSLVIPPSPTKSCTVAGNKTKMPAGSYMVHVVACNSLTNSGNCEGTATNAGPVSVSYLNPPGAPTLAPTSEGARGNVPLSWSAGSGTVNSYSAYGNYSFPSGGFTGPLLVCTTANNVYGCTDTPGTAYNTAEYYVQACNNAGCTSSNTRSVTLTGGGGGCKPSCNQAPQPAPAPTTGAAPSGTSGSITLPSAEGNLALTSPLPALKAAPLHINSQRLASLMPPVAPKRHRLFDYAPPAYEYYAGAVVQPASGTQQAVGITVGYQYNANGYLSELYNNVTPSVVYWQATGMNARNQVTDEVFGGGAVTSHRDYYANSGYIENIQSGAGTSTSGLQNLHYDWYAVGNLQDRQSNLTGASLEETFQYDQLNRLAQSQVTNGAGSQPAVTYSYDNLGDVTCKSDITGQACGLASQNYTYGGTGGGPHAVTSVNGSWNGSAFTNSYGYDTNGNLASRVNGVTGVTTTIAWNSDNLPTCMDNATTAACNETGAGTNYSQFVYAPDKHRYYQSAMVTLNGTTSQETTTYVGPLEIVSDNTGTHNRYHLTAYGRPVTIVDLENPAGGNPAINNQYVLTDHLGSVDVATDATGTPVSGTGWSFDAFGQRRDPGAWNGPETSAQIQADRTTAISNGVTSGVTHRGHTGHEMLDHLGLVHANGRVYDPALGRFLSVDPVFQFETNAQSLNPYSYVMNNPLSLTDPSGYAIDQCAVAGGGCATSVTVDQGWSGGTGASGKRDAKGNSIQAKFDKLGRLTGIDFNKISGAFDNGDGTMSVIGGRNGADSSQSISEPTAESKQSGSGGTATLPTNSVGSLGGSNETASGVITVIGTDASQTTGGIHTDKVDINMEMSFRNADDGYASPDDAAIAQYKAYNTEYLQAVKDGEELTGLIVSINGRFFFSNMVEVHAQFTATENLQGMRGDLAGFTHTHPDGTIFNGLDYVTPAARGLPYYERNSIGSVYRWDSLGASRYQNYIRQMEQSGSAMAHETEIANPGRWGISNICPGGGSCVN